MKKTFTLSSFSCFFLLAIILSGSLSRDVAALNIPFMSGNDILYLMPGVDMCKTVGASYSTSSSIPSLTGSDNAEKIWNFLKGEGLSDEQAAGIMGNLEQESGYKPDSTEGNGVGYGIIQWSFERRTVLESEASKAGVPASDLGFQLKYMMQEAETTQLMDFHSLFSTFGVSSSENVWDSLKKQTSVEKATTFWHDSFERSNDYVTHGSIQHRIDFAKKAYEKFTGKSAGGSSFGGGVCSAVGSGDLIATLLEYAWPEHHVAPFLEMRPAYEAAVKKGQTDGKNVGGGIHPGIDCAGFVNLLITDSGFDPAYNYDGKGNGSAGATGEAQHRTWMKENWTFIGNGGSPEVDEAKLQPGDVGVSRGDKADVQHIFIYVGQVSGFGGTYASASYMSWRTPMVGGSYETSADKDYDWYRKS